MVKKRVEHKTMQHNFKKVENIHSREDIEHMMLENFVSLQNKLTDMVEKLDSLSDQTAKLLRLFELSAKSFIEKSGGNKVSVEDKETLDKIDKLLEQNKTIAKSLVMMEEKIKGNPTEISSPSNLNEGSRIQPPSIDRNPQNQIKPRQLLRF